eukprot:CAMPEP_0197191762 /NCGR_PEP_ID=MMETSP1423-20130617/23965_1 /TAXON_ID=476441 /ORGANISM="Pseudo-nitzschia heimii, Strain UNC1101" /LENGTH=629 /DNA_ID=CAMNT_0042644501 /DNA_START=57 /DNA_END=1943 /DNA_ORIENTATION=-
MISQKLFDETVLENQDVFEYTDDEAVKETINEFIQQQSGGRQISYSRLEHISLTHPSSAQGKKDRELQDLFVVSLESEHQNIDVATSILRDLQQGESSDNQQNDKENGEANSEDANSKNSTSKMRLLSLWFLMLQNNLWTKLIEKIDLNDDESNFIPVIDFVAAVFPDPSLSLHPLAHDLKRAIAPFWFASSCGDNSVENSETDVDSTTLNVWYRLFDESLALDNRNSLIFSLSQLARILCNGCEDNKKSFVRGSLSRSHRRNGEVRLQSLVDILGIVENDEFSSFVLKREICRLIAVLTKFQPLVEPNESSGTPDSTPTGGAPLVSSAHANVKEFHQTGAITRLHRIAKECLGGLLEREDNDNISVDGQLTHGQKQELLCEALAALRTMAIDNDIVQNMIAIGILDTTHDSLELIGNISINSDGSSSVSLTGLPSALSLTAATMGLVRNLCANDEVKTTICKSSLPLILQVMQQFLNNDGCITSQSSKDNAKAPTRRTKGHAILQEHICGILAAMALRQPHNAHAIVEGGGHILIFDAMRAFPNKVTLQRQGCLAIRNIVSRLARMSYDEDKTKILDAGAEHVLQNIAGKHHASAEEAYAALRDLGCNPKMYEIDQFGNTVVSKREEF